MVMRMIMDPTVSPLVMLRHAARWPRRAMPAARAHRAPDLPSSGYMLLDGPFRTTHRTCCTGRPRQLVQDAPRHAKSKYIKAEGTSCPPEQYRRHFTWVASI